MTPPLTPTLLTIDQAAGLLARFLPGRDARAWLEQDRRYSPLIPFELRDGVILYLEAELVRFVQRIAPGAALRGSGDRRGHHDRRERPTDRRQRADRRRDRRASEQNVVDRRFAARSDRRGDLDRRIRGWVDRRCIVDRRQHIEVGELDLELIA